MLPDGKFFHRQASKVVLEKRRYQFFILLAAGCLTTMTGGLVAPVFPEMVKQIQLDGSGWTGVLLTIHALTSAVATPLMGILADRVGKLKVMLPCLLIYAFFGVSTAFVTTLPFLLLTRGILGAASGGIAAATIGLLSSVYEGEARSRILGYATSAMTTASVLIPLIGGWVGQIHWQYTFYLYALGVPLAAIAALGFWTEETQSTAVLATDQLNQLGKLLRQINILKLYLFLGIAATVVQAVVIYAPFYFKEVIDAGSALNGLILAIRAAGAAIIAAVGASWLGQRIGEQRAVALGFTLMALALSSIPFLTELHWIIPAAALFGVGFGIITPNLYNALAILAPIEVRASILAIGTGFNSLGQFVSPVFLGPIWENSGLPAIFYVSASIALSASVLSLFQQKPEDCA